MDFQTAKKITPEKKKENEAKLKCKVCGKEITGKETLSRHISHAHDEINEVRREKLVIDAYYGKSKVDKVIHDFENGKYPTIADLPIKIYKYLNMAGIKKGGKVVDKDDGLEKPEKNGEEDSVSVASSETEDQTLVLRNAKTEEKSFVEDAIYNTKEDTLTLVSTSKFEDSLTLEQLREFLEDKEITTKKLFVDKDGEISTISSIELVNADNGGEDSDEDNQTGYSRCVVAYSPQQSDSDEDED